MRQVVAAPLHAVQPCGGPEPRGPGGVAALVGDGVGVVAARGEVSDQAHVVGHPDSVRVVGDVRADEDAPGGSVHIRALEPPAVGQTTGFETVMQLVTPVLAYTVEIERLEAKVGGGSELSELALRVTCIYRREDDGWKLLHRHADPRVSRQSAESVLER